jgi:hypothetical protein
MKKRANKKAASTQPTAPTALVTIRVDEAAALPPMNRIRSGLRAGVKAASNTECATVMGGG